MAYRNRTQGFGSENPRHTRERTSWPNDPIGAALRAIAKHGYWTLNEYSDGTGAVQRDDSGPNGWDAMDTNTSPSAEDGQFGRCLSLNSANDEYLTIASSELHPSTSDFCCAFWGRTTALGDNWIALGNGQASNGFYIHNRAAPAGQIIISIHDGTGTVQPTGSSGWNDGDWHHFAHNFDRDGNWTCYVDGPNLEGSGAISSRAGSIAPAGPFYFGRSDAGFSLLGDLDEVYYAVGHLLTADQITRLYESPLY